MTVNLAVERGAATRDEVDRVDAAAGAAGCRCRWCDRRRWRLPQVSPRSYAGQVRAIGIRWGRALPVVAVPRSPVLVGHHSPPPVGQRGRGDDADLFGRVDAPRGDGAQVQPTVTEVELVDELLAGLEVPERELAPIAQPIVVVLIPPPGVADLTTVGEVELVQVRAVPARERVVDRDRQLPEGVGAGGREDPPRPGPQVMPAALDEVDSDRQPGAGHRPILSDRSEPGDRPLLVRISASPRRRDHRLVTAGATARRTWR